MDAAGDAGLAGPLGEADVILVAMGQDDRAHVGERPADRGELTRQVAPVRGRAGIDDRDGAVILEDVAGDDLIPEAADPRRDLGHWAGRAG